MKDVSQLMNRYRESARVLWNSFLREDADYRTVDTYAQLKFLLFDEIVLAAIGMAGYVRDSTEEPYPFLRIVPCVAAVPVLTNSSVTAGVWTWQHPVMWATSLEVDLRFIDYFDFAQMGFLDLHYYRALVRSWPTHPDVVGCELLLEVQHASVMLDYPDSASR